MFQEVVLHLTMCEEFGELEWRTREEKRSGISMLGESG